MGKPVGWRYRHGKENGWEPPWKTRRGWGEDRKVQQSCLKQGGEPGGVKQSGVGLWMIGASETFKVYQQLKSEFSS